MRIAVLLVSMVTLLGWGGRSYADVHAVTVERSGQEPSCLKAELVAEALRQDASLRVTVSSQKTSDPSALRITGSNERFTIIFVSEGREVGQLFEGVVCEAATQVVSAFVLSLLNSKVVEMPEPAPVVATEPVVPELEAEHLAIAVREELEARGDRLGAEGLRLSIARTSHRGWAIWVTHGESDCSVFRELKQKPGVGEESLVMHLATLGHAIFVGTGTCLRPDVVERAEILKKALEPMRFQGSLTKTGIAGEAVLGVATGTLALAENTERELTRGIVVAGSGMWIAGGLAGLAMGDDPYAGTVASVSALVGAGTVLGALAFMGGSVDARGEVILLDQRHDAFLMGGLTLYAQAAMLAWDRSRHPPISPARLSKGYSRLKTKALREKLSADELAGIEQDFIRHQSPSSSWLLVSPLLVGGAVSVVAAIAEEDAGEQQLFGVLGGLFLAEGLLLGGLTSIPGLDAIQRYQRELEDAGLDLAIVPTGNGVATVGRF